MTATVGAEVRALCGRYRVSQTRLADWLDIPRSALSHRLTGRTEWRVVEIERIAEGFDVHPAVLFGAYDEGPRRDAAALPINRCAIRDSNPEPADYWFTPFAVAERDAVVLQLRPRLGREES